MKPFLIGIVKCKKCPFTSKLNLCVDEYEDVEYDGNDTIDLDYFKIENGSNLRRVIKGLYLNDVTEDDIMEHCNSKNSKINQILYGTNILSGSISCEECDTVYPIYDSILDTLKEKKEFL